MTHREYCFYHAQEISARLFIFWANSSYKYLHLYTYNGLSIHTKIIRKGFVFSPGHPRGQSWRQFIFETLLFVPRNKKLFVFFEAENMKEPGAVYSSNLESYRQQKQKI